MGAIVPSTGETSAVLGTCVGNDSIFGRVEAPRGFSSFTDHILPIIVDERDAWHVGNVRPRSRCHPPCAFESRQFCATGTLRYRNARRDLPAVLASAICPKGDDR